MASAPLTADAHLILSYLVRPLRIAWIISDANPDAIAEVMDANTTLWGGIHNPVLPLGHSCYTPTEVNGLLGTFDPDYVVHVSADFLLPLEAHQFARALRIPSASVEDRLAGGVRPVS